MKRLCIVLLSMVLLFSFASCSSATKEQEQVELPSNIETENTETKVTFQKTGIIKEQKLLDDNDFTVSATSLEYNSYAAILNIEIENKSNKELSFASACYAYSENTVNGIKVEEGYFNSDISAGETKFEDLYFQYDSLQALGIEKIDQLKIGFYIKYEDGRELYRMTEVEISQ